MNFFSLIKHKLFNYFSKHWYQKPNFIIYLLIPFSYLFFLVIKLRQKLYKKKLFKTVHFPVPIIIVGNITAGGTGKTPMVIWLANLLKNNGYRVGIVSRGYGASNLSSPKVATIKSKVEEIGDEALLIVNKTKCPMVVSPKRVKAVDKLIKEFACNIVISDDGLQHYSLGRNLEILMVDGERLFGNEFYLPAGPLREPITRLKTVDFIVCNGEDSIEKNCYVMKYEPLGIISVVDMKQHFNDLDLKNVKIHAVAGIGNPGRFFKMLRTLGLNPITHEFPDHYKFVRSDFDFLGEKDLVVMTEKDAVKCYPFADKRYWCLPITAKLSDGFEEEVLESVNLI